MAIKLTWLGHACWNIDTPNGTLLIDPFLSGNPVAAVQPDQVNPNYILISHAHGDHLGDALEIAKRTHALVISNFEIANYFEAQGCQSHGLHIGGSREFPFGRVKLTIAHHGSSFPDGHYGGNPSGFLLTIENKKIYDSADTALFYDMKFIGEEGLDVAMIPIGDNYTMGPEDAERAARLLHPKYLIPMHYNTWDLIAQNPDAFAKRVVKAVPRTKVVVLKPGESLELVQSARSSSGRRRAG